MIDPQKYRIRSYAEFRRRAPDPSLSRNEKCGFAEEFRAGYAERIVADIGAKLPQLTMPSTRICDIGAGCSELAQLIVAATEAGGQQLTVIDCPEMLALLPSPPHLRKLAGRFPDCLAGDGGIGPFDAILAYSVANYVYAEGDLFPFVEAAAALLADQGRLLIGDIPNATMRQRFIGSPAGKAYHRIHYPHLPEPDARSDRAEEDEIDDRVVLALLERLRGAGFHAFVLPQPADLPMATRREDVLIVRP